LVAALALHVFCADASLADNSGEDDLDPLECGSTQCGQACMVLHTKFNCDIAMLPDSKDSDVAWETYLIKDTGGVITPFDLTLFVPQIGSMRYRPAENKTTGSCPYIQFFVL
jgi:hypothetical protein